MASRWFIPYAWQGYMPVHGASTAGVPSLTEMPDLSRRRYIVFIDEFESRDAMDNQNAMYAADTARKDGQLSRRVVELSPSGVVLRERSWHYTPEGVVMDGSGLGEELVYKRVYEYFTGTLDPQIDVCPPIAPGVPPSLEAYQSCSDPTKMTYAAANELLLVEHRSIGWSFGCGTGPSFNPDGQPGEGLVTFFEYGLFPHVEQPGYANGPSVHLVAEGVQRGAGSTHGGVKHYTKQYFRDPVDPATVTVHVEFTGPPAQLLVEPPACSPGISHDARTYRATHYLTIFADRPDPDPDPNLRSRAEYRMVVHPPRQQRPDGDWYYPIEREDYDEQGNVRWSVSGLVQNIADPDAPDPFASLIFTYHICHSSSKVLVLLLGGVCSVVDGETGRVLEHTSHVECVASGPDSSRMVLLRRGRKSPRGSAKMLESRTSLRGEPEFSVPCDLEWFDHVPIGRGWIAVAETRIGGKLLVFDFSGRVLWRHQLPIEDNFWCCMAAPDQLTLLIIVRDQSSPSLDPKSRRPDRVVLFEGMTGRVLKSADFPSLSLGREPAMHGAVVIGFEGILHVPSLEFEPRDFRVRAKGG